MEQKLKIFGIGAAILLVMVALMPPIYASVDQDTAAALDSFAAAYEDEIDDINTFIEENNLTEDIDVDRDMIELVEEMLPDMQDIVDDYLAKSTPPQCYDGHTAYWKSDYAADFFDDSHYYRGHVLALNKALSDLFCYIVVELEEAPAIVLAFLILVLPVPDLVWWFIIAVLVPIWGDFVDWCRDDASDHPYGIHFDWFKRDIWHPSPLLNKFFYLLQPDQAWDPEDLYPESTWTAILGPW